MGRLSAFVASQGVMAPLKEPVFRRIWLASLLSNLGLLIQAVGSAWAMTELTDSADMVALVQTAIMLPVMLTSLAAGAIADMYDRRIVALAALLLSLCGALLLTVASLAGWLSPPVLLTFCFTVGTGMALFGPSWQASVSEQVPMEVLPSAVALNGISFNIARSFGPAIGGVVVAVLGVTAAFATNAILYLPLLAVLYFWRRPKEPSRLPPEKLGQAMALGVRYLVFAPTIHVVLLRALAAGLAGSSVSALMPLVAQNLLKGGAQTFGVMLGAFGLGAVSGALLMDKIRSRFQPETAARLAPLVMGFGVLGVAFSRSAPLTAAFLVIAGAGWMNWVTLFNVGVQMSAPRWVAGRALAAFQAAVAGGIALGSWGWGAVARDHGVAAALTASGVCLLLSPILGLWLRMPVTEASDLTSSSPSLDLDVKMALKSRSGPVVVELEYIVDTAEARDFYGVMQQVRESRRRNGAYGWSISRDIADPERWVERFHFATWLEYLRHRDRPPQAERDIQTSAWRFHRGDGPPRISRMLERPFGSVRWKDASPDRGVTDVLPLPPVSGGG